MFDPYVLKVLRWSLTF